MPSLRDQLSVWPESLSDLAVSAEDRFGDGQALLSAGRFRGAVYLLGLAAEMWLKVAGYRLFHARAADAVGPYANRVRQFMSGEHRAFLSSRDTAYATGRSS